MTTNITPASLEEVMAINKHKAALARAGRLSLHGAEGMPSLFGAEGEGGFMHRGDVIEVVPGTAVTVDGQPLSEIWQELNQRLAVFNQNANFVISLFTFPVDRAQDRVAVYETPKFEDASEFGRPAKVRLSYLTRAFPLKHYDLGFGYTQEFIDSARGSDILSISNKVESGWWDLNMGVVLTALFDDTNTTDDDGLTIKRLYNADGEVPPNYKRWTHDGTHTHYLTSGNTSPTGPNLNSIEEHLIHHGYGDNGETLVLHVHRDEMAAIRALGDFVPAVSATVPAILSGPVRGAERAAPAGLPVEGYHGKLVIVENNSLASGYLVAHATGGSFANENPVGLRRHENPGARGLRLIEGPNGRYPLIDAVYDGYTGAGVRHRGGAVVMQVTAGAYAVPTF